MVFSSIPPYNLDPPNWQQNPNFHTRNNDFLPPWQQQPLPPPPPPPPPHHHGVGGSGSIRPGSMVDQARMANIPMPETALKCPRCESTHTKFCYFNNYSLSQPRHFCKTCRRYWTRGGALRSVPVGGGCRRNKRSSKSSNSSNSKSEPANSGSSNSAVLPSYTNAATSTTTNILGGLASQLPQLRFMPTLTHLMDYGPGREIGLNYGGISSGPIVSTTSEMNFQIGSNMLSGSRDAGVASLLCSGGGGSEQWQMQQMPQFPCFLGGFDPSIISQGGVLYRSNINQDGGAETSKLPSSSSMMSQLALVKMEANNNHNNNNQLDHQLDSARQFTGPVQGKEHQWSTIGTTAWTDLSGFSSSPTSNPL